MGIKKNRRKGGEGEGKMKRKPEMRGETGKNEETIGKQIRDDIRADEKRTGGRSIEERRRGQRTVGGGGEWRRKKKSRRNDEMRNGKRRK